MERKTQFELIRSSFNPSVTVLKIDGFIDVNAAPQFETILDDLVRKDYSALLLDFADVTYISSAGVGVIVGSLQAFRSKPQGDIKLLHVSPKIMRVFQHIGLDDLIDFLEREEQVTPWLSRQLPSDFDYFTLHILNAEITCGQEFTLQVGAYTSNGEIAVQYQGEPSLTVSNGSIFPKELKGFTQGLWQGKLLTTGTGQMLLMVEDGEKSAQLSITVREKTNKAVFPCFVSCNFCGTRAKVGGIEIYRCRQCNEIFYVDAWAHVISLNSGSPLQPKLLRHKNVNIRINSDINYLTSLRRFIAGICEQEYISDMTINEVVLATEEVLLNIIEHSYEFNPYHSIDVCIKIRPRQLDVRIRDRGKPFDITQRKQLPIKSVIQKEKKGGLGGIIINHLMDKLHYHTYKNYNQLVMSKRLQRKTDYQASAPAPQE